MLLDLDLLLLWEEAALDDDAAAVELEFLPILGFNRSSFLSFLLFFFSFSLLLALLFFSFFSFFLLSLSSSELEEDDDDDDRTVLLFSLSVDVLLSLLLEKEGVCDLGWCCLDLLSLESRPHASELCVLVLHTEHHTDGTVHSLL